MSEHTPEPLRLSGVRTRLGGEPVLQICGADDKVYAFVLYGDGSDEQHHASTTFARRIVACVNACKGLRTEDLEQAWPDGGLFKFVATSDYDALEEGDRADEAVALLRELVDACTPSRFPEEVEAGAYPGVRVPEKDIVETARTFLAAREDKG